MKLLKNIALLPFLFVLQANAQNTDTAAVAPIEMDAVGPYEIYDAPPPAIEEMVTTQAAPDDYYYGINITNKNNEFKTKTFAKLEANPDKPASYRGGIGVLMTELQGNLVVPYSYSVNPQFVILQVTVGKDSILYNPKILQTEGTNYSKNAKDAVQQLNLSFSPAMKNGKPVDSILLIPIRFEAATKEYDTQD